MRWIYCPGFRLALGTLQRNTPLGFTARANACKSYWILLIAATLVTVFMTLFMPESYAPTILRAKAQRMQKETGRTDLHALLNHNVPTKALLATSIVRPAKVFRSLPLPFSSNFNWRKLLTRSPIVFLICSYVATIYGILYLMFTTIPTVFQETYGWPTSLVGLAYTPSKCPDLSISGSTASLSFWIVDVMSCSRTGHDCELSSTLLTHPWIQRK